MTTKRPNERVFSLNLWFCIRFFSLSLVIFLPVGPVDGQILQPHGYEEVTHLRVMKGDLTVEFVDNSAFGPHHRKGYNGIASLLYRDKDKSLFVPEYAGFNLEHIFGGDSLSQLFEPRDHPMSLYRKSDDAVLLYQSLTPESKVESLTEFNLVAPYYIDVTFSCVIHDPEFFRHNYAGLFWASYIDQPSDKRIYFSGISDEDSTVRWIGAYSERHGEASTHRAINEKVDFYFADDFNARLASHFSNYRFAAPFYYGRFEEMAFACFFNTDQVIRFSQSPTGGGPSSPAWDFQFLIPDPKPGQVYTFTARLIYKPFTSALDIQEEFTRWIGKD